MRENVEDGFAQPVRGGADRLRAWPCKRAPAQRAADNAHGLPARLARPLAGTFCGTSAGALACWPSAGTLGRTLAQTLAGPLPDRRRALCPDPCPALSARRRDGRDLSAHWLRPEAGARRAARDPLPAFRRRADAGVRTPRSRRAAGGGTLRTLRPCRASAPRRRGRACGAGRLSQAARGRRGGRAAPVLPANRLRLTAGAPGAAPRRRRGRAARIFRTVRLRRVTDAARAPAGRRVAGRHRAGRRRAGAGGARNALHFPAAGCGRDRAAVLTSPWSRSPGTRPACPRRSATPRGDRAGRSAPSPRGARR